MIFSGQLLSKICGVELGSGSKMDSRGFRGKSNDQRDAIIAGNLNPIANWWGLFAASSNQTLSFHPPHILDGNVVVSPSKEVIEERAFQLRNSLVAQFIGRVPNFRLFQRLVNTLWGTDGEVHVKPVGVNLFIIQFPNVVARDRVLESGPWHIQNKPLIVRKMGARNGNVIV